MVILYGDGTPVHARGGHWVQRHAAAFFALPLALIIALIRLPLSFFRRVMEILSKSEDVDGGRREAIAVAVMERCGQIKELTDQKSRTPVLSVPPRAYA